MALNREFASHIEDLLSSLGAVSVRSMFGGGGVYLDGVMFGLIADDVLFFKTDEKTRTSYETEGMKPFTYDGRGKSVIMPYWQVPDRLFDDEDALLEFARAAFSVALDSKKPRPSKRANKAP